MITPVLTYQPATAYCESCKFRYDDCRDWDFSKMQPISKGDSDGTAIVRCAGFQRETGKTT